MQSTLASNLLSSLELQPVLHQLTSTTTLLFTALLLLTVLFVSSYTHLLQYKSKQASKPAPAPAVPGPRVPPRFDISRLPVSAMSSLIHKFGAMFSLRLFWINILVLCDVDSMRDALVGQADVFAGRVSVPISRLTGKDCGMIFVSECKSQQQRRFVMSVLRRFGFGMNITERAIHDELSAVCDQFAQLALTATPVNPAQALITSASNVIRLLVFGERQADQQFDFITDFVTCLKSQALHSFIGAYLNKLISFLPGDLFGWKKLQQCNLAMEQYLKRKIHEHRQTIDWDNERDFIDAYLVEMRKRDQDGNTSHDFTEYQLVRVLVELFIAGVETSSSTLTWALLLMAKHPEVQARVQAELDNVIGDKQPQIADRSKLTYTTAVLCEVQRFVTMTSFAVFRRTVQDTELHGYFVPKNTIVIPYLLGAHRDASKWGNNAHQFDPSHFYDEHSQSLVNMHNLIPYGVGRRACPGESLATQELFVMFAGLMQRFRLTPEPHSTLPDIQDDTIAIPFRAPPQYKVLLHDRHVAN